MYPWNEKSHESSELGNKKSHESSKLGINRSSNEPVKALVSPHSCSTPTKVPSFHDIYFILNGGNYLLKEIFIQKFILACHII